MTRADLHLHSNQSDGVLSPEQLAEEAQRAGLTLMAITDHDTFAGSDALRAKGSPLPLIAGVELSLCDLEGLHLLAYGTAEGGPLRRRVAELAEARDSRGRRIVERLAELGFPLDWQDVARRARGTVGRPHIARAMVHAGYAESMQEAFARFLGHDAPAYIPSSRMDMDEALGLIRSAGFVPVLAHPYELKLPEEQLFPLIARWREKGLAGVEVYHPSARRFGFGGLRSMAARLGLLVTGGSDFHQEHDKHGSIGCMSESWTDVEADLARLEAALAQAEKDARPAQ